MRAELPNPDRALRPGMLLSVDVFQPERRALVIPEIAVVQVADAAHVFVVDAGDTVAQRAVVTGARRPGDVEIVKGLAAGERIVVDGVVKLRDGMAIVEAPQAADAPATGAAKAD